MIAGHKVLALITARGGSKGLPGKNIRLLGGKPLVAWSVEQALAAPSIDRVVISSDDPAIIAAAVAAGAEAPFVRPPELARDDTPSAPVVIHALDALGEAFDWLVLLQPTSPLRVPEDLEGALAACVAADAPACVGVTEAAKSPYWMYRMDEQGRLSRLLESGGATRRQDLPPAFAANGAVFVAKIPWFRQSLTFMAEGTIGYVMPSERSVDIDSALDLRLAELLLADRG